MIKYIIHSGWIKSKNDGQMHWIGYGDLIRLYNVNPRYCRLATPMNMRAFRKDETAVHLYPRYDGNYNLKEVIQSEKQDNIGKYR